MSTLMTGLIISENIFSWPGVGQWLLEAVYRRDYPVIHAGLLVMATMVLLVYLFLDFMSLWLTPHLQYKRFTMSSYS
jgi:ABC-type dipeptide/oligopeptide/nickel transport system permease component